MDKKSKYKSTYNDGDDKTKRARRPAKRRICEFCQEKTAKIDYKNVAKLRKYVTEKGKIIPRRATSVCAWHQRDLATAIKRARVMALLPFKGE